MRITSYSHNGTESYGVLVDGGIVDARALIGGGHATLRDAIAAGALKDIDDAASGRSADHGIDEIDFLPVITNPDKILAIGLNYRTHVEEGGDRPVPTQPMIFTRYPNSHVGHQQAMIKPKASDMFDFEGEMAVIIGQTCRHVSEADALGVVAGYSCYNDGSVRDYQRHTSQFIPGKNFYKSGAFGPWMITTDEIPDPAALTLTTRLNGEEMQRATTDDLIFNIPQLINYISTFTELYPGDVIATGTTGGVGFWRDPKVFMKEGDTIEVELDKIGVLTNPIVNEK